MLNIDALKVDLHSHYDVSFDGNWLKVTGGYECDVWHARALEREWIIRVCPSWRSDAELNWIYDVVTEYASYISEVVAPFTTCDHQYFFRHHDRAVLAFPYIAGDALDTANYPLVSQAAELLAQIHKLSSRLVIDPTRPPSRSSAPTGIPLQDDPESIQDAQLDEWYDHFVHRQNPTLGLMHGDYYRANILCDDDTIRGVIDWDGCSYGQVIREVAWATWEHCQTASHDDLDTDKAKLFVKVYRNTNDRLTDDEYAAIIPLIRYHLRYEIQRSVAIEEAGEYWDHDYRLQEIRAFTNLRKLTTFPMLED